MTDNELKYWAFLSYSQQDNGEPRPDAQDVSRLRWGNWLHDALKAFAIPAEFIGQINGRGEIIPDRIHPVFQDEQELAGDVSLSAETRTALEQSRCLVVICSPHSAKSLHVNEAVRYFKQFGRNKPILPIIISGEPNASEGIKPGESPEDECFVPALRHPVRPDGTLDMTRRAGRYIVVDARHGAEKREILAQDQRNAQADLEAAKVQLIALLIGVAFNGLWWREQRRHFIALAEARDQAREALAQVEETRRQLEEAQRQTREAQKQILDVQNLPREVHGQIEEAQTKAAEAQEQARAAQKQLQELQSQSRSIQSQLEEARDRVASAEGKFLEAQNQAQDARRQAEETQRQAEETQRQLQEARSQVQKVPEQIQETQQQADEARRQAQEFQSQVQQALAQVQEARGQAEAAQKQVDEARRQAEEARRQVQEAQGQTPQAPAEVQAPRNEVEAARSKVQDAENQFRQARRMTKVLALVTLIALLMAGVAWWQRKAAVQLLAKSAFDETRESDLAHGKLDQEQIQRALRNASGQWQDGNRSLDELAGRIPPEEIPEALKASPLILDDLQRSGFQKQLLVRLGGVQPLSAMACATNLEGKIVNDDGLTDSNFFFQVAVLGSWVKTDLPGALGWVHQLPDGDARNRALGKIIPELAANNPTNTLALLNDFKPAPGEGSYALLFQRWATNDPVQAIQERAQIPGQDADDQILSAIMSAWVDQQPDAAVSWAQTQPDSEARNKALETCIWGLAKTDMPKALALAASLPEATWRSTVIANLFKSWAAKDLEAATTACRQLPDSLAKSKAWDDILSQRIAKDPAAAVGDVTNLPAGDSRQIAIAELSTRWADADTPAALAWAQSLSAEAGQTNAVNQVIATWARKDPQAAMQYAGQHPELSGEALVGIAKGCSPSDLTAATNWIASLPAGETKDRTLLALSGMWAQADPKGLAAYALALPAGDGQTQYLTAACRQLAIHDLPGTVELLKPLNDADLRQSLLEQAARASDLVHVDQAAKYVADMPADDDQKAAIKGLLSTWTPADPETAASWLQAFPTNNPQTEPLQSVIKAWSQTAPEAAAKWLANLPAGTADEGTVNAFIEGAIAKYPEFVAQWTQSVTDEAQRQKYQVQAARQWLKSDPASALKWINSLALPDDVKQQLKAELPPGAS
jgi:uncharacterized coiled-coil DUF342 family protein